MRRTAPGHVLAALVSLFGVAGVIAAPGVDRATATRPNIILLLADDLGYGDLSCYGAEHVATPNLDSLARSGMRFRQFYAASAVCTPTRASILTGRYPLRFDIRAHFKDGEEHLPRGTVTLPKLLKRAGYATAHIGKWHLGGLRVAQSESRPGGVPGPLQHGFDHYLCNIEGKVRRELLKKRLLYRTGGRYMYRNDAKAPSSDRHWTDIKIDEAVRLLERYKKDGRRFFLNVWFDVPHTPYEPAPEPHLSKYEDRAKGDDLLYRSMVSHMDANIGRLIAKLKELDLYTNTLIVFTSDNGPSLQGNPGPWAGGKADLREGGIRVPMIAAWPGHIPAGTESAELAHTIDLLPTFCAAAGAAIPKDLTLDGRNLLPYLTDREPVGDRGTVFWQLDLYTWYPQPGPKPKPYATEVARRGRWKLLAFRGKPVALYDLQADPKEKVNRIREHPQLVQELGRELAAWLAEPRRSWKD